VSLATKELAANLLGSGTRQDNRNKFKRSARSLSLWGKALCDSLAAAEILRPAVGSGPRRDVVERAIWHAVCDRWGFLILPPVTAMLHTLCLRAGWKNCDDEWVDSVRGFDRPQWAPRIKKTPRPLVKSRCA